MIKLNVVNESCEFCASEYIRTETDKLSALPDDQKKTNKIHAVIHAAYRASCKPCIQIPCREQQGSASHYICVEHLYKMIDAVKEYEDNASEIA